MELETAIGLLRAGVSKTKGPQRWADLGAGNGLFAKALVKLLPQGSKVVAVDKESRALHSLKNDKPIETWTADFVEDPLPFAGLDGVLMANALHYVKDKDSFLAKVLTYLHADGIFIVIEYDQRKANPWVPFPITFDELLRLSAHHNLKAEKLSEIKSKLNSSNIYSALLKR